MEKAIRVPTLVALPLLAGYVLAYYASAEVVHLRIEDKSAGWGHSRTPQQGSPTVQFLVYTDRGVFQVGREPLFLEFSNAERYHALEKGASYRVLVAGWRAPFINWYPNIIRIFE
jgi:hypothetical protein